MTIKVLIADDHKIVREGLRSLLQKETDIRVIGEAADGRTALSLVQKMSPDVVIMDVAMPGLNGVEATRQLVAKAPRSKVIALSMYSDRRYIVGMLNAGAAGYLPKDCAFEELVKAVRAVAANQTYLSSGVVDVVVKDYSHLLASVLSTNPVLSGREKEVLQLMAEGETVKEIAHVLCVSVKTVETYREHLMKKLGIRSVAELTKYAIREGLTSLNS